MTPAESPRATGLTGLLFAILFSVCVIVLKVSVSDVSNDSGGLRVADKARWLTHERRIADRR
jgi:hypothetical protein